MSSSLISALNDFYKSPQIDLLVNDDTYSIARIIPFVKNIYTFSYHKKKNNWWKQEKEIFKRLFNNYDLSINLTSSDRSVIYALLASRKSISAIEKDNKKSWWKKILLNFYYFFDENRHILLNNLQPLNLLKIKHDDIQTLIPISRNIIENVQAKLDKKNIKNFIIFHPSAQYKYKIYPKLLRHELLKFLSSIGISIIITGTNNKVDSEIKKNLPQYLFKKFQIFFSKIFK